MHAGDSRVQHQVVVAGARHLQRIEAGLAQRILALKDIAVLPSASTGARPTSRDFQAIRTDDEAIDRVFRVILSREAEVVRET